MLRIVISAQPDALDIHVKIANPIWVSWPISYDSSRVQTPISPAVPVTAVLKKEYNAPSNVRDEETRVRLKFAGW